MDLVREGDWVIAELISGKRSFVQVKKNGTAKFGKETVPLAPAIGAHHGTYFEIRRRALVKMKGRPGFLDGLQNKAEVPEADNSSLVDDNKAQKLQQDEIRAMKDEGKDAEEIISALVQNSSTFDGKTEFSKQKYVKKKALKHCQTVRILRATSLSISETYFTKSPAKICNLRTDTLAQILHSCNARPGAQVLLVDECQGIVAASIAERIAGMGRLLCVSNGRNSLEACRFMNFTDEENSSIVNVSLRTVITRDFKEVDVEPPAATEVKEEEGSAAAQTRSRRPRPRINQVKEWLNKGSESLVIAGKSDPSSLVDQLWDLVLPSAPVVIYSEYVEVLADLRSRLETSGKLIRPMLTETWMREYQVLPLRTHPHMSMNTASGYLLFGYKSAQ